MRLDPHKTFRDAYTANNSHGYHDIEMMDNSPKTMRRLWRLTIPWDSEDEQPYATLRRSETDDGELDYDVALPAAFVPIMIEAARMILIEQQAARIARDTAALKARPYQADDKALVALYLQAQGIAGSRSHEITTESLDLPFPVWAAIRAAYFDAACRWKQETTLAST